MEEKELFIRAQRGERDALELLYEKIQAWYTMC